MAKTSTAKKNTKAPKKRNVLAGLSKVKATTQRELEKEVAKTGIEESSLDQDFVDFSSLIQTRGWQRLVFINTENARLLGEQILKKATLEGEPLDEIACDRLRDQRDAILEFVGFPQKIIERYQLAHAPEPEDDSDPYETAEQAVKARGESSLKEE